MASPRKREMARQKKVPNLPQLVEGFILTLTAEGKSPKTISFYGGNLRRFLWYIKVHGFPGNAQELTVQHIREFLAYVRGAEHRWGLSGNGSLFLGTRNKAIILLFLVSGIRLSELANIRLEDVDFETGIIKVTGEGLKQRLVGIGKTTRVALWKYKAWRPDGSP